jgi:hypothetical protein
VGCCSIAASGVTTKTCYYSDPSDNQSTCQGANGNWTSQ